MSTDKNTGKQATNEKAQSDAAASYDEFKEFEGQKYTGMKIGRGHKWYYDREPARAAAKSGRSADAKPAKRAAKSGSKAAAKPTKRAKAAAKRAATPAVGAARPAKRRRRRATPRPATTSTRQRRSRTG